MRQKNLMVGSGFSALERRVVANTSYSEELTDWVSLDFNPDANPDILFDMNEAEKGVRIPVDDNTFDEIHTYEVLEHYGRQGDYKGFFTGFKEYWRILKPDGLLIGTCPLYSAMWAWGDPGHTRVLTIGTFGYLTREAYDFLGKSSATDYRRFVDPHWWQLGMMQENQNTGGLMFAIKKSK